jgi:hypothetical protein
LRSHGYVKEHSSGVAEEKMRWGISGALAESNCREPASASRALALTQQNGKSKMTRMKMLSAVIILSAAVGTPVFAQDAAVRGTGSRHGLEPQPGSRGAYNLLNGPSYVTSRTRDRWNPQHYGIIEKDPSIPGGEDTTLRAPSS